VISGGALLIGAGGLGCGAALGLAAAGVARLGVVDDDSVDESNLHRQVLHRTARVGQNKAESLRAELALRHPEVTVVVHPERFTASSAARLLAGYDVLLDGSDNLGTKFLGNDAAVLARKPLVHGAAVGTTGQLLSVPAGGRPCYRCLFEDLPPPDAAAPSCAEAGVLGPVPGVIGALQASEAVRFLRGQAPAFAGRLLRYEAVALELRTVSFRPNPTCAVCGDRPSITALVAARYGGEGCAT
jgi:molybdopterin/thiamine biosynthesis adenylyltransferase